MARTERQNLWEKWQSMKEAGEICMPLWRKIARYTGNALDPNYIYADDDSRDGQALDQYMDAPTAALSVNQAGDSMMGTMWGTGERAFEIVPSDYVLELADQDELADWYKFASKRVLFHMNHSDCGFNTALRPYAYDQCSFGNSGIGLFPNKDFRAGIAENCITARGYGVDNTRIDEGKAGVPEWVGCVYHWRVNQIVAEFAMGPKGVDKALLANLPMQIQDAWKMNDLNNTFDLVFMAFPRDDFNPRARGTAGKRYRGVWFMDNDQDHDIFYEEGFSERPIAWGRAIRVRGERYGRAPGTMLISTIQAENYVLGKVIEILEKMGDPALGVWNSAIFGDGVLDTSPQGLTVFNSEFMPPGGAGKPAFPLFDVGDPKGIIEFLLPYFKNNITTGFKVDALLDFNQSSDETATAALQRYAIRGNSLKGYLLQQKTECLEPCARRGVSICLEAGELGVNARLDAKRAKSLRQSNKSNRVIPDAVLQTIKNGRSWYTIKWNNELEKLVRNESVQKLVQIIQVVGAIAQLYQQIIDAVDWYQLLADINDNLDFNNKILMNATEFKNLIKSQAQMRQAAALLQAGQAGADIQKTTADANKSNQQAINVPVN